ncbi:hypothetical protein DRP53_00990 [candidate division WOR-3 bacterium]|uniref:JAB domain-containing protein n=1 Tax=candidate division WOR-3 bacterium TaxID=2052148 RepID=A0A660SNH9_UNCW3|nr:MAG: hypothetical protein DRP53_00990 [candidate division WOR-3 bacterium]
MVERIVYIERDCLITLLATVIETPQNESFGFLLGKLSRRKVKRTIRPVVVLDMSYPLFTAERRPSHVALGNIAAWNRVQDFLHGFSFGLTIMGEFHSHPQAGPELSDFDLKNIVLSMLESYEKGERLPRRSWLEMVIAVNKIDIQFPKRRDWYWEERGRRLFFRVWVKGRVRYDVTIACHIIPSLFPVFRRLKREDRSGRQILREGVKIARRRIVEAKLYTRES